MRALIGLIVLLAFNCIAAAQTKMWVSSDESVRHTCPSTDCGVVGKLLFRESVMAHETRNGWVRISKYYDASCKNGKSEYVDSGNSACSSSNGIVKGQFSEWVSVNSLSLVRPDDPGKNAIGMSRLVAKSDDFKKFETAFVKAASGLISSGRCTADDFLEMGGWLRSSNHGEQPIYFTYCGGMTRSNRIYLNAITGNIFK